MQPPKSLTLRQLATLTGGTLVGDPAYLVTGVAPLEKAGPADISFLALQRYDQPQRYLQKMIASQAGVVLIAASLQGPVPARFIRCDDPSRAFQMAVEFFFKDISIWSGFSGIHPTAVIHPTAQLGEEIEVGPHAVIDAHTRIGDRTKIGAGCYIGAHSTLGENCRLYPNVTVRERCSLGDRVTLQPGSVIGSCGFGYTQTEDGKHQKLEQIGTVFIESDVAIGANTTVDRARFTETRIRRGTKIDNHVQIAHGVDIGEDNLIVAQSGVAGSASTGRYCVLAAQSGVAPHVHLGDRVWLAARAGATKSLSTGKYHGIPATPAHEYNRNAVILRNIHKYITKN